MLLNKIAHCLRRIFTKICFERYSGRISSEVGAWHLSSKNVRRGVVASAFWYIISVCERLYEHVAVFVVTVNVLSKTRGDGADIPLDLVVYKQTVSGGCKGF